MNAHARGTMPREAKGPIAAPPVLENDLQPIVDAVATWPDITATVHWHLFDRSRVDGVDFYYGGQELGHIHLDGAIHLATAPTLGSALIKAGVARPFRYQRGWVEQDVGSVGVRAAIDLFRHNYDALRAKS